MGKGGVDGIWLFAGLTSYVGRYEMIRGYFSQLGIGSIMQ